MNMITQALKMTYDTIRRTGYIFGALILSSLVLVMSSGVIISLFYIPFPGEAYDSVAQMVGNPIISFARNVHFWSADAFLVILILHMTRVVLSKITDKSKRIAYWIGLAMSFLVANEMLFGTFMRSDQESYEAYAHFWVGAKGVIPAFLQPIIGPLIDFIGTGETALVRFFITHAFLIPGALIFLIFLHSIFAASFRGLTKQTTMGLAAYTQPPQDPAKPKRGLMSFPQLRVFAKATLVLYAIIFALAYFFPAPLLTRPYGGLEITKPPWYLMWIYGLENQFGLYPVVYAPLALLVIFAVLPFFSSMKRRLDAAIVIYMLTLIGIVVLGLYALLAPPISHLEHFHEAGAAHEEVGQDEHETEMHEEGHQE